jgi:hypothetical protein
MAGQFSFGRDDNSIVWQNVLEPKSSMPQENCTVILTLKCTNVELITLNILSILKTFFSSILFLSCFVLYTCVYIEIADIMKNRSWICHWICFQIRTFLSCTWKQNGPILIWSEKVNIRPSVLLLLTRRLIKRNINIRCGYFPNLFAWTSNVDHMNDILVKMSVDIMLERGTSSRIFSSHAHSRCE